MSDVKNTMTEEEATKWARSSHWPSDVCVCEHYMGDHYRKNYKVRGSSSRDASVYWGNVDRLGCDGAPDCDCTHFQHVRTNREMWHFENGFMWEVKDPELKKIYAEEIKGTVPNQVIMNTFQWIVSNTERYVELLKARGASFERKKSE